MMLNIPETGRRIIKYSLVKHQDKNRTKYTTNLKSAASSTMVYQQMKLEILTSHESRRS
jgi:hypothetical protein